jgi:hypothetical protein
MNLAGVGSLETCDEAESGLEMRMETTEGIEIQRECVRE